MGPRRKASQTPCGRGVPSAERVFDQQEKEQEEQKGLIRGLTGTLHHFFGGFSPSIRPCHRPPKPFENHLSPCESCLCRCQHVSVSAQGETTDWVVAP
jgi:hypothetical protein